MRRFQKHLTNKNRFMEFEPNQMIDELNDFSLDGEEGPNESEEKSEDEAELSLEWNKKKEERGPIITFLEGRTDQIRPINNRKIRNKE